MFNQPFGPSTVALLFLALGFAGCKTATSGVESNRQLDAIAAMSEDEFVKVCKATIQDPAQGPMALALLQQYAETTDCRAAYPKLKLIAAEADQQP